MLVSKKLKQNQSYLVRDKKRLVLGIVYPIDYRIFNILYLYLKYFDL